MYSKSWLIIRDDAKKTFEVTGSDDNTNYFMNEVHGMQKAGMQVSCMTPPVTNKAASKEVIKISGYTREEGLYQRILKTYRDKTRAEYGGWEE